MYLTCSDDHLERYEIINIAINRAKQHYQQARYNKIVYVGDRRWDYHAAQKINIGFVGIGSELTEQNLIAPLVKNYEANMFLDILMNKTHSIASIDKR